MVALPLPQPPAPFELAHALESAQLVRTAYRVTKAWEEADSPAPEDFSWEPPPGYDRCALIWTEPHGLLGRPRPVALLARTAARCYLAFRGTEDPSDMWTNLKVKQVAYAAPGCADFGQVHEGFMDRYMLLRPNLERELFPEFDHQAGAAASELVVAGHSMGAAVSTLAIPDLAHNLIELEHQRLTHYSFGSPRVGCPAFAAAFDGLALTRGGPKVMSYRLANSEDPTVHVPPAVVKRVLGNEPLYQHVGTPIGFSHNYGSLGLNHHHTRTYLYALEHPDNPRNPSPN